MHPRKITMYALVALLLAASFPPVAAAQSLKGVVVDADTGKPVANARVLLFRPDGNEVMYGVRSDASGRFDAAEAIRDGEFAAGERIVINIVTRGYQLYEERMVLPRGETDDEYRLKPIDHVGQDAEVPRRVWIKVLLIEATGEGEGKPEYSEEIAPVVGELRSLFKFKHYRVIGRAEGMGMEGSTMIFQSDPGEGKSAFEVVADIGFGNGYIRLNQLVVSVQESRNGHPAAWDKGSSRSINTTLNLPEGEIVILGASRGPASEGSLILTISAAAAESSQ